MPVAVCIGDQMGDASVIQRVFFARANSSMCNLYGSDYVPCHGTHGQCCVAIYFIACDQAAADLCVRCKGLSL